MFKAKIYYALHNTKKIFITAISHFKMDLFFTQHKTQEQQQQHKTLKLFKKKLLQTNNKI